MIDISRTLQDAHALIASSAEKVRDASVEYNRAQHQLKVARANATIRNSSAKSQTILNAQVELDGEVIAFTESLIMAKAKLESAQIELERETNKFISARKLAGLSDEERKAMNDSYIENS